MKKIFNPLTGEFDYVGEFVEAAELSDYVTKIEAAAKLQESKEYTDARIQEINAGIATQTIELQAGYKWVSFNVEVSWLALQKAFGDKVISIETSDDGTGSRNIVSTYDALTNS